MKKNGHTEEISRFLAAWLGARQLIQAANFNRFQKAGLSATQFMTLNLLPIDETGLTLSALAKRMNLGLATLTKTVDSLQARGLLIRTKSGSDRRVAQITLTAKGKTLQNESSKEFHGYIAALFSAMQPEQRKGLVAGLESLVHAGTHALPPQGSKVIRPVDAVSPAKRNDPRSRQL